MFTTHLMLNFRLWSRRHFKFRSISFSTTQFIFNVPCHTFTVNVVMCNKEKRVTCRLHWYGSVIVWNIMRIVKKSSLILFVSTSVNILSLLVPGTENKNVKSNYFLFFLSVVTFNTWIQLFRHNTLYISVGFDRKISEPKILTFLTCLRVTQCHSTPLA